MMGLTGLKEFKKTLSATIKAYKAEPGIYSGAKAAAKHWNNATGGPFTSIFSVASGAALTIYVPFIPGTFLAGSYCGFVGANLAKKGAKKAINLFKCIKK